MKPTAKETANHKKSEKESLTIRGKIFLGFLLVIVVALVLLFLCQVVLFDLIYSNTRINEIRATARHVLLYADDPSFYSELASATARNSLCATVLNGDGSVAYEAESTHTCLIHSFSSIERQDLAEAAAESGENLFCISYDPVTESYDAKAVTTYAPISSNAVLIEEFTHNGETMTLLLDGAISPVGTVTKTSASLLIVLGGLLILIAVLLATYISKAIARPIAQISKQAKQLSEGRYERVEGGTREVEELNDALDGACRELNKVESIRRELIANISHDLRTPLTLIGGYAEMMRDLPSEVTAENLQTIVDETTRLTSLVNDMLDISRLESGVITPRMQPFSLTDSVEKTVLRYQELTRTNGYRFSFEYTEKVTVTADEELILQVLTNLLNNAMTYTGEDQSIAVRQLLSDGEVRIEVTDTGEGIEPDKLSRIWERYYKVDAAHKRAAKGTGLGLSIVRSVIDLHKGRYGVRSTPGAGSTFWFALKRDPSL